MFMQSLNERVYDCLIYSDPVKRAETFAGIMNEARELEIAPEVEELAQTLARQENEPELWELPQPFEKSTPLQPFPVSSLPPVLGDFLKAVSAFSQVYPEMGVLPMLSVLALCVQGKAVVQHPGNSHTEPLALYSLTVASPGQRKSGVFSEILKPVQRFVSRYNKAHGAEVAQYQARKNFLETQRRAAMNAKNGDFQRVQELTQELFNLEPKHPLKMVVTDTTPEALAMELFQQGGRLGVLSDEGAVVDILSGAYSAAAPNLSLFLSAYDGSPYTILRRTSENIELESPLLTISIMAQPSLFANMLQNQSFIGRGFLQRFMFAHPESKTGFQTLESPDIPANVRKSYDDLIERLLRMPYSDELSVIRCDAEGKAIFREYHDHLQETMRPGGLFTGLEAWASKHFGRCLRIAAILHLCEHDTSTLISGLTALNAVSIAMWCENHALRALSAETLTDGEQTAKYVLHKLKSAEKSTFTRSEVLRLCQKHTAEEIAEAIELLEDMRYVRLIEEHRPNSKKPTTHIKLNPLCRLINS